MTELEFIGSGLGIFLIASIVVLGVGACCIEPAQHDSSTEFYDAPEPDLYVQQCADHIEGIRAIEEKREQERIADAKSRLFTLQAKLQALRNNPKTQKNTGDMVLAHLEIFHAQEELNSMLEQPAAPDPNDRRNVRVAR